ncbi:methyltransferase FkbM [Paenibacillus sp. Soil787]|nr:methyltransferase FkbM [Paenibacillus sp. Soil787]
MLDLPLLCKEYEITPKGVIHIGAHDGQELPIYESMGIENILLIEANPEVFKRLEKKVRTYPHVQIYQCAICDRNGYIPLRVTSLDQSSSILPLKQHLNLYANVVETHQVIVPSKTLDTLLNELQLNPGDYNLLTIDIQGAELLAFQGAVSTLNHISGIVTEVNLEELYEGCALLDEIDIFLELQGFHRVALNTPDHPTWGDAFYLK